MKVLHFVGGGHLGTSEQYFPADRLTAITSAGATNFDLWFSNSDGAKTDHQMTMVCVTANDANELQEYFAWLCAEPSAGAPQDRIYDFIGNSVNSYGTGILLNTSTFSAGS